VFLFQLRKIDGGLSKRKGRGGAHGHPLEKGCNPDPRERRQKKRLKEKGASSMLIPKSRRCGIWPAPAHHPPKRDNPQISKKEMNPHSYQKRTEEDGFTNLSRPRAEGALQPRREKKGSDNRPEKGESNPSGYRQTFLVCRRISEKPEEVGPVPSSSGKKKHIKKRTRAARKATSTMASPCGKGVKHTPITRNQAS